MNTEKQTPVTSLATLQQFHNTVFGPANGQLEPVDMFLRILRYLLRVLEMVRTKETGRITYYLCTTLSWLLAISNRYNFDLELKWKLKFPNLENQNPPLSKFQELTAWNHEGETLETRASQFAEAVAKVGNSLGKFRWTHHPDFKAELLSSIVECCGALCNLASVLGVDMQTAMAGTFGDGCTKCHKIPCVGCDFNTAELK